METASQPHAWEWLHRTLRPTRWSLIGRMRNGRQQQPANRASEDDFCRCYWYPLYSYLRHSGYGHSDAQDYVQSFLLRLLEEQWLEKADPQKGRLRNYLITLLVRHVAAQRERQSAKKRGGAAPHVPFDWEMAETSFQRQGNIAESPEEAYRCTLATRLVDDGIAALRRHYQESGKAALCEALLPTLEGPLTDDTYEAVAARMGMKPATVRMAAIRMRDRFRRNVRTAASALVGIPEGPLLDAELQDLFCNGSRPTALLNRHWHACIRPELRLISPLRHVAARTERARRRPHRLWRTPTS